MPAHPARFAKVPIAISLIGLAALAAGCAPERVDMNVHDIFTGDAARYALQTQMSPAQLASVGGFLPADTWPSDVPPLLLDVQVVAENKIDLAASNIDVSGFSGLRLHWVQLVATPLSDGALTPTPTKVEIYVGPSTATSITDPGVLPLASGAYPDPLAASMDCDGGCTLDDDGGIIVGPVDGLDAGDLDGGTSIAPDAGTGSRHFDDGGPDDAGSDDAGVDDAGTFDGGSSLLGSTALGQTLVFSEDAQTTLQSVVFSGQPFSLFVVLHLPIDSASNPSLPTGGADLLFDIQYELAQ